MCLGFTASNIPHELENECFSGGRGNGGDNRHDSTNIGDKMKKKNMKRKATNSIPLDE